MSALMDFLNNEYKGKWAQCLGADERDIRPAERELGLTFPPNYRDLVWWLGCLVINNPRADWFGCNVADEWDVVNATKAVRQRAVSFPAGHFVLQMLPDGSCIIVNAAEEVFHFDGTSEAVRICDNLLDWVKLWISGGFAIPEAIPFEPVESESQPEYSVGAQVAAVALMAEESEGTEEVSEPVVEERVSHLDELGGGRVRIADVARDKGRIVDYGCECDGKVVRLTKDEVLGLIDEGRVTNATKLLSRGKWYVKVV